MAYETKRQVEVRLRPALRRGVMTSLGSALTAGERHLSARDMAGTLEESLEHARTVAAGMLDRAPGDPQGFSRAWQEQHERR